MDLSLLKGIRHTGDAGFSTWEKDECLKGTRRDVLLQIEQWLVDEKDQRIFWLNGLAGTGKSTIAQTFAKSSFSYGKLGASFFCSRDSTDRSNLRAIFPTLAFQLAHRYPSFREELLRVIGANHDVEKDALNLQLEKLIVNPLKATGISTLIIIDALDECTDKEPASALLSVLSHRVGEIPQVKFFITGRPELPIQKGFQLELLRPITDVLKLHDVAPPSVNKDIRLYLWTKLTSIPKTRSECEFPQGWPRSPHIDTLCNKAAGLFIYASTVVKFIESRDDLPTDRLNLILDSQSTNHEESIDELYTQILKLAFHNTDSGTNKKELYSRFKTIVGAVLLVFHPLSRKAVSDLVRKCKSKSHISITLNRLHSLLDVPGGEDDPIRVFHKSFPDFLTDHTRCIDKDFFVEPSVHHEDILFSCLELMKDRLEKNICKLDDYAVLSKVEDLPTRRKDRIESSLEYACRFWTRHLANISRNESNFKRIQEAIDEFFKKDLLCWIEVLIIMECLGAAVYAINEIRQWYISVS